MTSESLTEANIDLDWRVGAALVQRSRQVEPQRPERGVIACTETDAIKQRAAELRRRALVVAAGIEERNDADRFRDFDAGLQVEHQARLPADRLVVWGERSGQLPAIGTDRSAAAGINPLVGGKLRQWRAVERAKRQFAG